MRWKEISEAPISDFGVHGDLNTPGSYPERDLKAMRNDKWVRKLHNTFEKTPYNFNLYLYNAPDGVIKVGDKYHDTEKEYARYHGLISFSDLSPIIQKQIDPVTREQGITVLLTQNEGDEIVPMTPWIVAHRIAHAIAYADRSPVLKDPEITKYINALRMTFQDFYNQTIRNQSVYKLIYRKPDGKLANERDEMNGLAGLIGKFRSAREGQIRDLGEFLVELMTQYIVQGQVKLNRPDLGGGRHPPEEPNALLDKIRKYYQKQLNIHQKTGKDKDYPTADHFAEYMTKLSNMPRPKDSVWVKDASGEIIASIPAISLDDPQVEAYKRRMEQRGQDMTQYTFVASHATPADIAKYEKKVADFSKYQDAFSHYRREGLISGPLMTATDDFDRKLDKFEEEINGNMRALLSRCTGKAFVL